MKTKIEDIKMKTKNLNEKEFAKRKEILEDAIKKYGAKKVRAWMNDTRTRQIINALAASCAE